MRLSVVIPVWNQRELVRRCLTSLFEALDEELEAEVIVVDDASHDGAAELVEAEFPSVQLVRHLENRGFAPTANEGLGRARGDFLLLLNSDTEISAEALSTLLARLEAEPDLAGVAPQLVDRAGEPERSCMAFPAFLTPLFFGTPLERWLPDSFELRRYFLREFDHETERDVEQPPAACWLLRRSAWESVGEFDESLELFFNDVDWCRRLARSGGRLRFLPSARVLHHGGASTAGREDFVERWQTDRLRYHRKQLGILSGSFVKACVCWTYLDWRLARLRERWRGEASEEPAAMKRAFLTFLRA